MWIFLKGFFNYWSSLFLYTFSKRDIELFFYLLVLDDGLLGFGVWDFMLQLFDTLLIADGLCLAKSNLFLLLMFYKCMSCLNSAIYCAPDTLPRFLVG